jgi:hypothetical protein
VWGRQVGLVQGTRWPAGCEPHGGKNRKTESWMVSWLSLKTKVESGLHESRFMSSDQRRLH